DAVRPVSAGVCPLRAFGAHFAARIEAERARRAATGTEVDLRLAVFDAVRRRRDDTRVNERTGTRAPRVDRNGTRPFASVCGLAADDGLREGRDVLRVFALGGGRFGAAESSERE